MSAGKWIALAVGALILQSLFGIALDARSQIRKGLHVDWDDSIAIGFLGAVLVVLFEAIVVLAVHYW